MKKKYFVVGGGTLQMDFVLKVKKRGFEAHVFDYDPNCVCAAIADVFHCISIDDKEGILEIAKELNPIAIQTVATEMGNLTACYVGEYLELNNNTYQVALNTTDKSLMKKVFAKNEIPNAKFIKASSRYEVDIENLQFPVVVKSSDRSAGRGVTFANNIEEFIAAFEVAYNESINKIVLIEEYLQGKQYSVETISCNGKHEIVAITEEFTDGPPNFIETHHLIPARVSEVFRSELELLINNLLNGFQITFGASHIEFMLCVENIKIIEIASRMGGWRDVMISLSSGIDYLDLIIDASLGNTIVLKTKYSHSSIVRMVLNSEDYNNYTRLKEKMPEIIKIDEVNAVFDENKIVTTLMDSQGFYYLQIEDEETVENFLS